MTKLMLERNGNDIKFYYEQREYHMYGELNQKIEFELEQKE